MSKWTILTNHGAVLMLLAARRQVSALEIATRLGITERSVRRILVDLETDGYVQKERDSRVNRYTLNENMPLRHADFENITIGEILKVVLRRLSERND